MFNSLVATCKDNKIDFETWLADILPRFAKTSAADIDTQLPHIWVCASSQVIYVILSCASCRSSAVAFFVLLL